MDEGDFPKKFLGDIPEHHKGDPELFDLKVSLMTIRLQLLAPLASHPQIDQADIEEYLSHLQNEVLRVSVQLEAHVSRDDEKTALQYAVDLLNQIADGVEFTFKCMALPTPLQLDHALLSELASSLKNLLDVSESIVFMVNAAKGEYLGLDVAVMNRAGEFGELGKKSFAPTQILDRLTQAHDLIDASRAIGDTTMKNLYVKPAGEQLTNAILTIVNAFDFDTLGGRLQRGFQLIGAQLYIAVEQLIRIFNFPEDTFYTRSGEAALRSTKPKDQPEDSIEQLLKEIELPMALLRIAQKIAKRNTEKP